MRRGRDMGEGWTSRARLRLIALADGDGWGYRRGAPMAVEATALAALGLLATARAGDGRPLALAARAADRLARLQRADGSLGVTSALPAPGWATPFAMLLWRALGSHDEARGRAARWLLAERVDTPPRAADAGRVIGHDTSIAGWPWVEGTHSWVEPSAMAVLALGRESGLGHPRAASAVRLIHDRAIASGGWNYGNNAVFGRELRPQPGPTGLALLALAREGRPSAVVDRAAAYLVATLPTVRAAGSLGWGVLGLRAWGLAPRDRGDWLAATADDVLARDDAAPRLGVLLLAAGESALSLFGFPSRPERSA